MAKKPTQTVPLSQQQRAVLEDIQGGWEPPPINLLRRVLVEKCRTELRPDQLEGKVLFARANDAQVAARMAFFVVREVFNFFRQYATGSGRPQFNQIEALLRLTDQPLPRRLSAVFDGNTGGCDLGQARAALTFLLLGLAPDPNDADRQQAANEFLTYFLRADDPTEGPRYMLAQRRLHGTPCSSRELSDELNRCTRKRQFGFTQKVEMVWVLGPRPFARQDLSWLLTPAVAEAIRSDVEFEFVFTDHRPDCWAVPPNDPLPSKSVTDFEAAHLTDTALRSRKRLLTAKTKAESGLWAFMNPSNQLIYARVTPNQRTPWAEEEFLFLLRGHDAGGSPPFPLVSRANPAELQMFCRWLDAVRNAVPAS